MTTKQEIAESLTVPELRSLADEHGIDLTGLSAKQDIADAVAAGATKLDLENAAAEGDQSGASSTSSSSTSSSSASTPNPAPEAGSGGFLSPEELQKRGLSAADLETGTPIVGGEPIIVKSFPERQSQPEVEAATEEQPGPLVTTVTVPDGDGEREVELTPDESARITSTVGVARHPIHDAAGHGSNPNQAAWGDNEEAVAANEEAYAARTQA